MQSPFKCCKPMLLLAAALALQGCGGTTNIITGFSIADRSQRPNAFCDSLDPAQRAQCTPELRESLSFAEIGKEIAVFPAGQGKCALASVDFGDGMGLATFLDRTVDHNSTWRVPHTYTGWPGKKTIRVKGETGCLGNLTKDITVGIGPGGREEFRSSFAPDARQCHEVMRLSPRGLMPTLRKGTGVRIETDGNKFNYGQPNQSYDASGDASLPVPAGYLFPNHRKFSLVYRLGTQLVQGEAGAVVFVANQNGRLEICVNDNPAFLTDNTGLMLITITVNERSAQ